MTNNSFDAYLFDLDGTLVNSLPLYRRAYTEVLAPHGVAVTDETWRMAVQESRGIKHWAAEYGIDQRHWPGLIAGRDKIYQQLIVEELDAMPGAEKLLIELLKERVLVGLVSHGLLHNIHAVIETMEWQGVFQTVVGVEDVSTPKPDPEGFLTAAKRLDVVPERCLVFEDSLAGLRAAKAAGMTCIVCPDPEVGLGQDELAEADLYIETLSDVTPELLESISQG